MSTSSDELAIGIVVTMNNSSTRHAVQTVIAEAVDVEPLARFVLRAEEWFRENLDSKGPTNRKSEFVGGQEEIVKRRGGLPRIGVRPRLSK